MSNDTERERSGENAASQSDYDCGCRSGGGTLCREQYRRSRRTCCDQDGRCCRYPCADRDPFWPEFAHPRNVSCAELYSGNDSRCTAAADSADEEQSCGCDRRD